jgi:hypothetical protein
MLGSQRRDQPPVGSEIARLAWLAPAIGRRRREAGLAGEAGLDLIAERALQRDRASAEPPTRSARP